MSLTRRKFLKAGMMGVVLMGLPLKSALAAAATSGASRNPPPGRQPNPLYYFNKSTFTPYVNTNFSVYLGGSSTVSVMLEKVADSGASSDQEAGGGNGECFSLQFTGPRTKTFGQKTYKIDHSALGTFSMFLVPISPREGVDLVYYEAIINRRLQ